MTPSARTMIEDPDGDGGVYELAHILANVGATAGSSSSANAPESSPVHFTGEHDAFTYLLGCVFESLASRGRILITSPRQP